MKTMSKKDLLKMRKVRLNTPAPKVITPKTAYSRKNKSWRKETGNYPVSYFSI